MTQLLDQSSSGKSLIKQTYLQLLGDLPRIPWKCLMLYNDSRPRARLTLWLHLHERLLTVDRLVKWGLNVELKCSLCQEHNEINEYLFVRCRLSRKIWDKVLLWKKKNITFPTAWIQYQQWTIENAKGKSTTAQVFKLLYCHEPIFPPPRMTS